MIIDVGRPKYDKDKIIYYFIDDNISEFKKSYIFRYKCDCCGKIQGVKYLHFQKTKDFETQYCHPCILSKKGKNRYDKTRVDFYNDFKNDVESEGYIMISEKEEYINAKTKLEVICPDMHHYSVNKNNGKSGKRCCSCNSGYRKVDRKRRCNVCEKGKDLELFHKNKRICKECRYILSQDEDEKERQKIRSQKGQKSEKGKEFYKQNKLSRAISSGMRYSLKNKSKNKRHGEDLVDFTYEEFINHIESKFKEGMTLENHGEGHIDHIRPVSSFDFDTPEDDDFKKCWSLDNLQPLGAIENLRKHNKGDG